MLALIRCLWLLTNEGLLLSLIQLIVDDLRCLQHAELALDPRRNLIWGSNGSGKTSLLEAIFLLAAGGRFGRGIRRS